MAQAVAFVLNGLAQTANIANQGVAAGLLSTSAIVGSAAAVSYPPSAK